MMRTTQFALVCALFTACAWGEGSGNEDDGNGDPQDPPAAATCGDGVCAPSEVGACSNDCGTSNPNPSNPTCGNNMCEAGESPQSCANDCQASNVCNGNGTCDAAAGETAMNCASDCQSGGGGNLDCNDSGTIFACGACISDPSACSALGVTEADCQACFGGP